MIMQHWCVRKTPFVIHEFSRAVTSASLSATFTYTSDRAGRMLGAGRTSANAPTRYPLERECLLDPKAPYEKSYVP